MSQSDVACNTSLDLLERSWDFTWVSLGPTWLDFPQNISGQDYRSVDWRLGRLVAVALSTWASHIVNNSCVSRFASVSTSPHWPPAGATHRYYIHEASWPLNTKATVQEVRYPTLRTRHLKGNCRAEYAWFLHFWGSFTCSLIIINGLEHAASHFPSLGKFPELEITCLLKLWFICLALSA